MESKKKITKKTASPTRKKPVALRAARPSPTTGFSPAGSSLPEAIIYSMEGKKVGTIALPEAIFGVQWKSDLVHQVTQSMGSNKPVNDPGNDIATSRSLYAAP